MASPFPTNIFTRQISKVKFLRLLKSEIRKYKPDVIYFHFGQTAASLIKHTARFRIPFIVAFYGHDISVALHQRRWRRKYKVFTKVDAEFLVLSNDVKDRVVGIGIAPSRITIYNYPLLLTPYLNVQKAIDRQAFTITIPGRLVEKKGHFILFKALQILNQQGIRPNLRVLGYGNDWAKFKSAATEAGLDDQVKWIDTAAVTIQGDFDEAYGEVLASTDLVVLPCITSSDGDDEAGPALVLCLAQASGTPVLTTPFAGHEVSILDQETGFLAAEGDPVDLATKIVWCIDHPDKVAKISEAGREYVQKVFDQEINLNKIFNVISAQAAKSPW